LSKPRKKPATKARFQRKEGVALPRDPEQESGERPDAPALAEPSTIAKSSWHDPDRVAKVTLWFVKLGADDEAAVDRAIKLVDLIDRKISERDRRPTEEATIPGLLDFRTGVVFITGTKRTKRAEANFIEYLVCREMMVCPRDEMREEASRSLRGLDEATAGYLERKKEEGFFKAELTDLRSNFELWRIARPGIRALRKTIRPPSESTPT
jgi:hypothetical protein